MNKIFVLLLFVSQTIFAQSISISFDGQVICKEKVGQIGFVSTGTFSPNNYFTIQLSDSSGNFTKPLELTRFTNASFQNIAFILPDTTYLGTKYRLRAVSTNPAMISNDNGSDLAVVDTCKIPTKPIITLQNLTSNLICTPTTATINWQITVGTFSTTNAFTVQLSDSSGSFHNPLNIAVASANDTTKSISIPAGFIEETSCESKFKLHLH